MWLTPCSSSSSSTRSASRFETLPNAAAPKIARDDSCPVAPKGARSITPAHYAAGARAVCEPVELRRIARADQDPLRAAQQFTEVPCTNGDDVAQDEHLQWPPKILEASM